MQTIYQGAKRSERVVLAKLEGEVFKTTDILFINLDVSECFGVGK